MKTLNLDEQQTNNLVRNTAMFLMELANAVAMLEATAEILRDEKEQFGSSNALALAHTIDTGIASLNGWNQIKDQINQFNKTRQN